jgi:glucose-1-phosphate adenylyltransferase
MFPCCKRIATHLFELQVCLVVGGDMQFALALDANSGPHPIRSCEGGGIDRSEQLSIGGSKQEKALRNRCFGGRVAATTQCILTSDACPETLVSIQLNF